MNDELRSAARALAAGGFVDGPEAVTVRRHRRELAERFRDELGWQITADDHGPVRVLGQPGPGHVARGLSTKSGRRFDPQRYALLFLVFASLEAAGARTTLAELFRWVRDRSETIDNLDFDHNSAADRRAFVHAVRAAVDLGVLDVADGDDERFADKGEGDALYRVDRARLMRLLATSKPPSLSADPQAAVVENLYTDTNDGHTRRRRHRVTRALVAEPVLYRDDLIDEEVAYLVSQEPRLRRLLADLFGLTLEVRAEGWVTVDADGGLSDQKFPAITVARAAALAVVDASRARRVADGTAPWSHSDLRSFVAGLGARFGGSWPLTPADTDGVVRVSDEAIAVLCDMRLALRSPDGVVVLPAAGRFSFETPSTPATETETLDFA